MKSLTICILLSSFISLAGYAQQPVSFYLKSISIHGKTNVNSFHFSFDSTITHQVKLPDNPHNLEEKNDKVQFQIPVRAFRSGNQMMRNDFMKLLKATQYPNIRVDIEKDKLIDILRGMYLSDLNMDLTLAGESESVQSQYDIQYDSTDQLLLEGLTNINLNDFRLDPPQKMLGLVQVKNTILIKFDIILSREKSHLSNEIQY